MPARNYVKDIERNLIITHRVLSNFYRQEHKRPALWKDYDTIVYNIREMLDAFNCLYYGVSLSDPDVDAALHDAADLLSLVRSVEYDWRAADYAECVRMQSLGYDGYTPTQRGAYNDVIPASFFYTIVGRALKIVDLYVQQLHE